MTKVVWDLHKSGYDFQKLKELVEQHKFRDINKIMIDETRQTFGCKVFINENINSISKDSCRL